MVIYKFITPEQKHAKLFWRKNKNILNKLNSTV